MSDCCNSARLNICVQDNEDYVRQFQFQSGDEPIDMTGWTIEMQVKDGFSGPALIDLVEGTPTANGSYISFLDAEEGQIELFIAEADIDALVIPVGENRKTFRYDIRVTDLTPVSAVFLAGEFNVQRGVTS
jgi:hypothetical protein